MDFADHTQSQSKEHYRESLNRQLPEWLADAILQHFTVGNGPQGFELVRARNGSHRLSIEHIDVDNGVMALQVKGQYSEMHARIDFSERTAAEVLSDIDAYLVLCDHDKKLDIAEFAELNMPDKC